MAIVYLVLALFLFRFIKVAEGTLVSPVSIIVLTWSCFPSVASSGIFGLYPISNYTHLIILLSLFSFIVTYYWLNGRNISSKKRVRIESEKEVNYKVLLLFCTLIAVWLSYRLLTSWETILLSGWAKLRHSYTESFGSSLDLHIHELFAKPLIIASMAIFVVDIIRNNRITKWKFLFILVLIVCLIEETVVFAARAMLVRLVFYFTLSFYLGISLSKKTKVRLSIIMIGVFIVMGIITQGRNEGEGDDSLFETIVYYFTASFNLLDYYINHPEFSKLTTENLTFGTCTFGCFYNFICSVNTVLFGAKYVGSDYFITQISFDNAPISRQVTMNALTTANYPFLMDFGFFGPIIGFSIMAFLIFYIKLYYIRKPSVRTGAFYICTLYSIFRLSVSYDFLTISGIMVYFYIWMLTKPINKKRITSNIFFAY